MMVATEEHALPVSWTRHSAKDLVSGDVRAQRWLGGAEKGLHSEGGFSMVCLDMLQNGSVVITME